METTRRPTPDRDRVGATLLFDSGLVQAIETSSRCNRARRCPTAD